MSTVIPVGIIVSLFALGIWLGRIEAKSAAAAEPAVERWKRGDRECGECRRYGYLPKSSAHAGADLVSAVVPPTVETTDPAAVTPHLAAAGSSNELPSK